MTGFIKRQWLLRQLGITDDGTRTMADLEAEVYALPATSGGSAANDALFIPTNTVTWYAAPHDSLNAGVFNEGDLRGHPIFIGKAMSISGLACNVTSPGTAGAVIRMGVYKDNKDGTVSLVRDCGTVDGSTSGNKTLFFSGSPIALESGVLYWLVGVVQGGAATRPTVSFVGGSPYNVPGGLSDHFSSVVCSFTATGISGALPASITKSPSSAAHKVLMRSVV